MWLLRELRELLQDLNTGEQRSEFDAQHILEVIGDRQFGVINFDPPAGRLKRQHQRVGPPR
jgi:hypothetical protein